MDKCSHPDCNNKGTNKIRLPGVYGLVCKKYCNIHYDYGLDLKESETNRIVAIQERLCDNKLSKVIIYERLQSSTNKVKEKIHKHITKPSASIRNQLIERDKCCLKCGSKERLTIDHIVPKSKGGKDEYSNYQILCSPCNISKGNLIIDYRINVFPNFPPLVTIADYIPIG